MIDNEEIRKLLGTIPIPCHAWKKIGDDFEFIYYNEPNNVIAGGHLDKALGSKASIILKDDPSVLEALSKCYKHKKELKREFEYTYKTSGEQKTLISTYQFIPPDLILITIQEKPSLKTETLISFSEEKYKDFIETMTEGLGVRNNQGEILYANKKLCEMLGYSLNELIGKEVMDFVHPDCISDLKKLMKKRKLGSEKPYEIDSVKKNGEKITFHISPEPFYDEDKNYLGSFGVFRDITEKKRAERELYLTQWKLKKRLKELKLLYEMSKIFTKSDIGLKSKIQELVNKLPDAFRFPKITSTRITYKDYECKSENFQSSPWSINRNTNISGYNLVLDVFYSQEKEFLEEEVELINEIVSRLKNYIEFKESQDISLENEQRYKAIAHTNAIGVIKVSLEGQALESNGYVLNFFGYSAEEFSAITFMDVTHPDDLDIDLDLFQKLIDGDIKHYKMEKRYFHKDGSIIWALITVTIVRNARLEPLYVVTLLEDITNKKNFEQFLQNKIEEKTKELEISEQRYRELFEKSPLSLWEEDFSGIKTYLEKLESSGIQDLKSYLRSNDEALIECISKTKVLDINQKTLDLYGAKTKDELKKNLNEFFVKESIDTFLEEIINFYSGNYLISVESKNRKLNGEIFDIHIITEILPNYIDTWERVLVSIIDISERKQIEQELTESEEKFRTISERALVGIIIFQNNQIKYSNKAAIDIFNTTAENLYRWNQEDLMNRVYESDRDLVYKRWKKGKKSKKRIKNSFQCRIKTDENEQRWLDVNSSEIQFKGKLARLVTFDDITEMKRAEQEIENSRERYRNAYNNARLYRDILAHDINNILQNIKSSTQLLSIYSKNREKLQVMVEDLLPILNEQTTRGTNLISNIRKLSNLKKKDLELRPLNLKDFLQDSISFIKKSFQSRPLTINISLPPESISIMADDLIEDVFENLMINSIKHNDSERVKIWVEGSISKKNDHKCLKLEFKDNGIGIPPSKKKIIFTEREDAYKRGEGMGLGLSLVKQVVENYGGLISVKNRITEDYSEGSNFILFIPLYDA